MIPWKDSAEVEAARARSKALNLNPNPLGIEYFKQLDLEDITANLRVNLTDVFTRLREGRNPYQEEGE